MYGGVCMLHVHYYVPYYMLYIIIACLSRLSLLFSMAFLEKRVLRNMPEIQTARRTKLLQLPGCNCFKFRLPFISVFCDHVHNIPGGMQNHCKIPNQRVAIGQNICLCSFYTEKCTSNFEVSWGWGGSKWSLKNLIFDAVFFTCRHAHKSLGSEM